MLLPTCSVIGAAGNVKWPCAATFALAGIVGAAIGSTLGKLVDGRQLLFLFALAMIAVGVVMLRPRVAVGNADVRITAWMVVRLTAIGLVVGAVSGFFGIGGGFTIVPGLMLATGMPILNAVGSSLFSVGSFGLTTAINYALSGLIEWAIALLFIAGGVAGGYGGMRAAVSLAANGAVSPLYLRGSFLLSRLTCSCALEFLLGSQFEMPQRPLRREIGDTDAHRAVRRSAAARISPAQQVQPCSWARLRPHICSVLSYRSRVMQAVALVGIVVLGYRAVGNWTFGFERIVELRLKPVGAAGLLLSRAEAHQADLIRQRDQANTGESDGSEELRRGIKDRVDNIKAEAETHQKNLEAIREACRLVREQCIVPRSKAEDQRYDAIRQRLTKERDDRQSELDEMGATLSEVYKWKPTRPQA